MYTRGTIAMAKVIVVFNMNCQNHLVHFILTLMVGLYVIMLMIFSFKMPWRYVEQVAALN
jgi:hypothetical protein